MHTEPTTPATTNTEATHQVRDYITQLRTTGQDELADRLETSLDTTNSASQTANKSSKT